MDLKTETRRIGRKVWLHPTLRRISRGEFTPAEMQAFVLQRHALAEGFVQLLETTIRNTDDNSLKRCLEQNLGDETGHGVDTDSHATWRANYLFGLGLSPPYHVSLWSGTSHYNNVLRELIGSQNAHECAGAVLLLERTIPPEFVRIRQGLERQFYTFRFSDSDDTAERERKTRVRLYLVDHEHHDARYHEPDLRNALTRPFQDGRARESILRGAELVAAAKVQFYDSVAEHLGK